MPNNENNSELSIAIIGFVAFIIMLIYAGLYIFLQ